MRIDILLPRRFNGTVKWGLDLAEELSKNGLVANIKRGEKEVLKALFSRGGDLTHTTVPAPIKPGGKPMIFTIHGNFKNENNPYAWAYSRSIKIADLITTPTRTLMEKMELPKEKCLVIPNGVTVPENVSVLTTSDSSEIRLLTISNFDFEQKARGILSLCESVKRASLEEKRFISLDVLGQGRYLEEVKGSVMSTKYAKIVFHGFQKSGPFLEKSHIYLHYSALDVMPLSILESMAKGKLVITTEYGAAHEIIESGVDGFIAKNDDEYTAVLRRAFADSQLIAKVGIAGHNTVKKRFDEKIVTSRWLEVYRQLIKP